jgi:hypothetical protein
LVCFAKRHKGKNFLNCYIAIAYSNRILYFFDAYYDENNVIQLKLRFLSITEKLAPFSIIFDDDSWEDVLLRAFLKGKAYSKQENES